MQRIPTALLASLVAASCTQCGAAVEVPDDDAGPPVELTLTGPAKRLCSGLWVSQRPDQEEILYNSVLWTEQQVHDYERGLLTFDVDETRRLVTARFEGAEGRARHFGDQGCVILPDYTDDVYFAPREVTSALPAADATPWPMGDVTPSDPLPADVDATRTSEGIDVGEVVQRRE